jgi:hypothetical protein
MRRAAGPQRRASAPRQGPPPPATQGVSPPSPRALPPRAGVRRAAGPALVLPGQALRALHQRRRQRGAGPGIAAPVHAHAQRPHGRAAAHDRPRVQPAADLGPVHAPAARRDQGGVGAGGRRRRAPQPPRPLPCQRRGALASAAHPAQLHLPARDDAGEPPQGAPHSAAPRWPAPVLRRAAPRRGSSCGAYQLHAWASSQPAPAPPCRCWTRSCTPTGRCCCGSRSCQQRRCWCTSTPTYRWVRGWALGALHRAGPRQLPAAAGTVRAQPRRPPARRTG